MSAQTGQTSAVSGNADYSKLGMLATSNEVSIDHPMRCKDILCSLGCFICDEVCEECLGFGNPLSCGWDQYYEIVGVNRSLLKNKKTPLFNVQEKSMCCFKLCCSQTRPMKLVATLPEENDESVFVIERPYRMGCCCCSAKLCLCGRSFMKVKIGGTSIGSVQQKCRCSCRVVYGVHDANDELLYTIERCKCFCECMQGAFDILTPDGEKTGGTINKSTVKFPEKCSVSMKLLFLCTAMMIELK